MTVIQEVIQKLTALLNHAKTKVPDATDLTDATQKLVAGYGNDDELFATLANRNASREQNIEIVSDKITTLYKGTMYSAKWITKVDLPNCTYINSQNFYSECSDLEFLSLPKLNGSSSAFHTVPANLKHLQIGSTNYDGDFEILNALDTVSGIEFLYVCLAVDSWDNYIEALYALYTNAADGATLETREADDDRLIDVFTTYEDDDITFIWEAGKNFYADDFIKIDDTYYQCTEDHITASTWEEDSEYWEAL